MGKVIRWIKENKFMAILLLALFVLLVASFVIYDLTFGINKDYFKSILPNITISLVDLIVTTFVLKKILDMQVKQKNKKTVKGIKDRYIGLLNELTYELIVFITGNATVQINGENENYCNSLIRTLEQINNYVNDDVCLRIYHVVTGIDVSLVNPTYTDYTYEEFLIVYKDQSKNKIHKFLGTYQYILPAEVITSIVTILDLLDDNILVTPLLFNIKLDYKKVKFNSSELVVALKKIGNELIYLYNYITC